MKIHLHALFCFDTDTPDAYQAFLQQLRGHAKGEKLVCTNRLIRALKESPSLTYNDAMLLLHLTGCNTNGLDSSGALCSEARYAYEGDSIQRLPATDEMTAQEGKSESSFHRKAFF